jgi:Flp pilus assembly protein TadG
MAGKWSPMRRAAEFRDEREGTALVEMALSIMLVLTVIFMTIEVTSAVYTYVVLTDAANEGLRYAIVHSGDTSGAITQVRTFAANSLHDVSKMSVSVTYPDGSSAPPNRVAVTVTYDYVPYLGFMKNPPAMHAYAESRLVN